MIFEKTCFIGLKVAIRMNNFKIGHNVKAQTNLRFEILDLWLSWILWWNVFCVRNECGQVSLCLREIYNITVRAYRLLDKKSCKLHITVPFPPIQAI